MVKTVGNEELEAKIKELIDIAEKFDESYRQKTFEVLLADYLRSKTPDRAQEIPALPMPATSTTAKPTIPLSVRAFLQQYNIPEDKISKMFLIEGEEIHPTYKLKTSVVAEAQIQFALLTALESALRQGGRFEFSLETVRDKCKEANLYDKNNFSANFKNSVKLFRSLKDEEHIELSPDGKAELAEAILAITE